MPSYNLINHITPLLSDADLNYLADCEREIKRSYKGSFIRVFSTLNRKLSIDTQKQLVTIPQSDETAANTPLIVVNWSVVRLIRVWLLSLIEDEEEEYVRFINSLFAYSDMNELEALYSSLSILKHPKAWIERCKEGVRSNIGLVQEAVVENNKYPFLHLDEVAWNQLVLKAFFTGKNILNIYGLFERNNKALAESIIDYIYERDSANRNIHPILWLLAEDHLPTRAVEVLLNSYDSCSEKIEASILRHVLSKHADFLPATVKEEVSAEGTPLEEILEAYKNR